jgi:hypothetical protein
MHLLARCKCYMEGESEKPGSPVEFQPCNEHDFGPPAAEWMNVFIRSYGLQHPVIAMEMVKLLDRYGLLSDDAFRFSEAHERKAVQS